MAARKWISALIGLFVLNMLLPSSTEGALLYGVDRRDDGDQLVLVDSSTGDVNVIGQLGDHYRRTDLALLDGRLFAVATDPETRSDLLEIDTSTGAIVSAVSLDAGGTEPGLAEALMNVGGQLVVGYRRPGTSGGVSNTMGDLALDGMITNPTNFPVSHDMDSLTLDASGRIYGVDASINTTQSMIYTMDRAAVLTTSLAIVNTPGLFGLTFTSTGLLFGSDVEAKTIRQFDPLTGTDIGSVSYPDEFDLLALEDSAIPEPSTFLIWGGLLGIGLFGDYWRRRKTTA